MYAVLIDAGLKAAEPAGKECYMVGFSPDGVCWEGNAPFAPMCYPGHIPHHWP